MEVSSARTVTKVQPRRGDSHPIQRSLAASSSFNGTVLEESREPGSLEQNQAQTGTPNIVERSSPANAGSSNVREGSIQRKGYLEILGETSSENDKPISFKKGAAPKFRTGELVRLLNSTSLGTVISERQLFRHRKRANESFFENKKVNLVKYCAWLFLRRHAIDRNSIDYVSRKQGLAERYRVLTNGAITVNSTQILSLIRRQKSRCALTGRVLSPSDASLDHIIPISRGGTHSIENGQVVHRDVNRCKGTLSNDEFIAICREVAEFQKAIEA